MSKATIETLSVDLKYIKTAINEIKSDVVPRHEHEIVIKGIEKDILEVKNNIADLEVVVNNKKTWQLLGSNIMTATLTALMATLITYFVQNSGS